MNCLNPVFRKTSLPLLWGLCFLILMFSGCRSPKTPQNDQQNNPQDTPTGKCECQEDGKSEQLAPFAKDILNDDNEVEEDKDPSQSPTSDPAQSTASDRTPAEDSPSPAPQNLPVQNTHFISCKCNKSGQPLQTATDVQGAGPHHRAAHKEARAACQTITNTQAVYIISCKPSEFYKVSCDCRAGVGGESIPIEGTGLNRLSAAQNAQAHCKAAKQTERVFLLKCQYHKQAPKTRQTSGE